MEKKTKKKLIIAVCILLSLIVLGYSGYRLILNYAGDKAMNMVISNQLEGMLQRGEITIQELEEIAEDTSSEDDKSQQKNGKTETAQTPEAEQIPQKQETAPVTKPATKPASTQKETVKKASEKIENSISRQEKDEMMRLISSRLTSEDVKFLTGLMSGGLTPKEGSRAAKLAYSRFTEAEITRIKEFWYKYKKGILKK